jgi:hypothetical protein
MCGDLKVSEWHLDEVYGAAALFRGCDLIRRADYFISEKEKDGYFHEMLLL